MSALIFFLVLSVIIVIHEFGHFIAARRCGVKVEVFSLGFGPKIIRKKIKETEFKICLIPFGGYVKMAGDERKEAQGKPWEYFSQPILNRIKIVFSGSFLNYVSAFVFLWIVLVSGYPQLSPVVGEVMPDYPAFSAGLKENDKIIRVDNKEIKTWEELQEIIEPKKEKAAALVVMRDNQLIDINITPKIEELENTLGEKKEVGRIGVRPKGELIFIRHNPFSASVLSLKKLLSLSAVTYKSIFFMMIGKISAKEAVTGPIGIYHITKDASRYGVVAVLHLMAIISMSLAIVNLLPFPILDGGHILFLVLEKIRNKPLSIKVEEVINKVALVILFCLFLFIVLNDFSRFGYWDKIAKLLFNR